MEQLVSMVPSTTHIGSHCFTDLAQDVAILLPPQLILSQVERLPLASLLISLKSIPRMQTYDHMKQSCLFYFADFASELGMSINGTRLYLGSKTTLLLAD